MSRLFDINPEDIESHRGGEGPGGGDALRSRRLRGSDPDHHQEGSPGANRFSQTISVEYNQIAAELHPLANYARCSATLVAGERPNSLCRAGRPATSSPTTRWIARARFRDGALARSSTARAAAARATATTSRSASTTKMGTLPNNAFAPETGRVNFKFHPRLHALDRRGASGSPHRHQPADQRQQRLRLPGRRVPRAARPRSAPGRRDDTAASTPPTARSRRSAASRACATPSLHADAAGELHAVRLVQATGWWWAATSRAASGTQYFPKNDQASTPANANTGDLEEVRINFDIYTLDYLGTVRRICAENVSSNLSFGVQVIDEMLDRVRATGAAS